MNGVGVTSQEQYIKVGLGYVAKGSMARAKRQFTEIKKTAAKKQAQEADSAFWRELETSCDLVLEKLDGAGKKADFPGLARDSKQVFEDRIDIELPDIKDRFIEKGREKVRREDLRERMENRDSFFDMVSDRRKESGSGEDGISYKAGVGQEEQRVTEESTARVLQDRIDFLEEELQKSEKTLLDLKRELEENREEP